MKYTAPKLLFSIVCTFLFDSASVRSEELARRGQYIFATAGGCACHTVPNGTPNVGARPFPIPFGTVYSTNITQDKRHRIGQIGPMNKSLMRSLREFSRDGSRILPVMPYEKYFGHGARAICRRLSPI